MKKSYGAAIKYTPMLWQSEHAVAGPTQAEIPLYAQIVTPFEHVSMFRSSGQNQLAFFHPGNRSQHAHAHAKVPHLQAST